MSIFRLGSTRIIRLTGIGASRLGLASVALIAAGCIPLRGGSTYQRQEVTAKRAGGVLVSYGQSTCQVDQATYIKVPIGAHFRCVWSPVIQDRTRRGSAPFTPLHTIERRISPPTSKR